MRGPICDHHWSGHSITVSGEHYANSLPDELFDRVAKRGCDESLQKAQQQAAAPSRTASQSQIDADDGKSGIASGCNDVPANAQWER